MSVAAVAVPVVPLLRFITEQPEVPVVAAQGQEVLAERQQRVKDLLVEQEIPMEAIILVVVAVAAVLLVVLQLLLLPVMGAQDTHVPSMA
jgi:hypothetical protein